MIVLILLLTALLGHLSLKKLFQEQYTYLHTSLQWTSSYATGLMLVSCVFFLLNIIHIPTIAIALFLLGAILYLWKNTNTQFDAFNPLLIPFPFPTSKNWFSILLSCMVFIAMGLGTYLFFIDTYNEPHGLNDAWSYWNLRAKFIARNPSSWSIAFSDLYFFHGDYPLFETGLIAFLWKLIGYESIFVPAFLCLSFFWMIVWAVYGFILQLGSKINALLAALFLSLTPFYVVMLSSQYVDMQVGLYFLMATGFAAFSIAQKEPKWMLLACFFAMGSGWVKNEGLLFIVVFFGCIKLHTFFINRMQWKAILTYGLIGSVIPMLCIVLFKLWIAPTNDLVKEGGDIVSKLNDIGRYAFIWNFWKIKVFDFGKWIGNPWWLFLLYFPIAKPKLSFIQKQYWMYVLLLAMLGGFFMIYVITYIDLFFHLSTSVHRLFFQLLPVFLFVYFASLKAPFKEA